MKTKLHENLDLRYTFSASIETNGWSCVPMFISVLICCNMDSRRRTGLGHVSSADHCVASGKEGTAHLSAHSFLTCELRELQCLINSAILRYSFKLLYTKYVTYAWCTVNTQKHDLFYLRSPSHMHSVCRSLTCTESFTLFCLREASSYTGSVGRALTF